MFENVLNSMFKIMEAKSRCSVRFHNFEHKYQLYMYSNITCSSEQSIFEEIKSWWNHSYVKRVNWYFFEEICHKIIFCFVNFWKYTLNILSFYYILSLVYMMVLNLLFSKILWETGTKKNVFKRKQREKVFLQNLKKKVKKL